MPTFTDLGSASAPVRPDRHGRGRRVRDAAPSRCCWPQASWSGAGWAALGRWLPGLAVVLDRRGRRRLVVGPAADPAMAAQGAPAARAAAADRRTRPGSGTVSGETAALGQR